ncbi:hypothetical protein K2Y00_02785 [Patescibacteria group bacterium]|nr:hypothetical protein [Patescibacteria group bacterium]
MELTVFLAKVFGLYMLIAGIAVLFNRRHIMAGVMAIAKERFAQIIAGTVALFFGLILVNLHNDWSTLPASLVSLVGWFGVAKGVFYLFLPEGKITKLMHMLTDRNWYTVDGVVAIVIGVYLAGFGYGWF